MSVCFKKKHPCGLHPEVVSKVLKIHLRTVFRLFHYGHLRSVSGKSMLADKK